MSTSSPKCLSEYNVAVFPLHDSPLTPHFSSLRYEEESWWSQMLGKAMLGSMCVLAQTWLENEKVKLLNLQFLVIKLFKLCSICCLWYPLRKHDYMHTFCLSTLKNKQNTDVRFCCSISRGQNGVTDLYQIEREMNSNLRHSCDSHIGPSSTASYLTIGVPTQRTCPGSWFYCQHLPLLHLTSLLLYFTQNKFCKGEGIILK